MNIIYIEPYYTGSHKRWIDSYKNYSKHNIKILSLPGNKWKWRMHGGAVTLADEFLNLNQHIDLILCSDFLNLPVFKSLCSDKLKNISLGMYFHENQLSYPWSPKDSDIKLKRDLHYHYINYTSSLVADFNLFNSHFHLKSYIDSIKKYLKKMPDFNNYETINKIYNKSSVLYIGCELKKFDEYKITKTNKKPLILWNHRWEFDKNPEIFFKILYKLKKNRIDFELAILGEKFNKYPEIFDEAKIVLSDNIIHYGYCESFKDYAKWLWKADFLPVTSNQDFFGISIIESTYCKCVPLLPKRLSYTELFKIDQHLFYSNEDDLYNKLSIFLESKQTIKSHTKVKEFDWEHIINKYDTTFKEIVK